MSDANLTISQNVVQVIHKAVQGVPGPPGNAAGLYTAESINDFPVPGTVGVVYLATSTGVLYYWHDNYTEIVPIEYNGIKYAVNPTNVQTTEGNTFWNADDHCLDTYTGLGGVIVQNGQELLLLGYVPANATTIPDGVPVSIDGSSGLRPIVYQTDVTNEASCRCFAGLSTMEITPGNHGFINLKGLVRGVNTSALNEGDRLWATNTTPFLTNVEPTSGQRVLVGVVLTKSANGLIYSSPRHFELTAENKNLVDGLTKNATFAQSSLPTGFIDGDNIGVSYNKTANTITLTHASGKIEYFFHGNYHYLTSPWTSSAHGSGDGIFFLSSTDGTTFSWSNTVWEFYAVQVALAYVKAGSYDFAVRESHGLMPWENHRADHNKRGTYRISGLGPTDATYALNTATDAATTPGFNSGVITDEDNQTTIASTADGSYTTLRVGAANATVIDTAATFPFRSSGSYILINNPLTGAETATTTNRYLNVYELLVPVTSDADSQAYRRLLVQPQTSFASLAAAQAEDTRTLLLGEFGTIAQELVYYTRTTYVTSAGDLNTGKCRIAGFSYVLGDRNSQINVSATIAATTAENVTVTPSGNIAATNVQTAIQELDTEKLAHTAGIITDIRETIAYEELTGNKTISFAAADVLYFYVNPAGASIQFTMPADPGAISKSGVIWVKNNTGKSHTWNTSPAIRFVSETDADTVPTPAAVGYWTRYTAQWNDNNGGTGFWAVALAGKDTA